MNRAAGDGNGLKLPHRHIRQSLALGILANLLGIGSPVSRQSKFDDTPSRKRSKPIAIELPARNTATAYTPLTGRGDHHKGYVKSISMIQIRLNRAVISLSHSAVY